MYEIPAAEVQIVGRIPLAAAVHAVMSEAGWKVDDSGSVFDDTGAYVAASVAEATAAFGYEIHAHGALGAMIARRVRAMQNPNGDACPELVQLVYDAWPIGQRGKFQAVWLSHLADAVGVNLGTLEVSLRGVGAPIAKGVRMHRNGSQPRQLGMYWSKFAPWARETVPGIAQTYGGER